MDQRPEGVIDQTPKFPSSDRTLYLIDVPGPSPHMREIMGHVQSGEPVPIGSERVLFHQDARLMENWFYRSPDIGDDYSRPVLAEIVSRVGAVDVREELLARFKDCRIHGPVTV